MHEENPSEKSGSLRLVPMSRLLLASFFATAMALGLLQPRSSAVGATRRSTCLAACADRLQALPALCVLDLDMCVWSPEVRR